ncbi:AraC family transcriptional regulator [Streptomyces platensis]|uniref:helix-turn-helix domain-containing protein n=1 Tax=Streptomyces platensis TaxID=58346 RepID=UPI002E11CD73|nr:AraC family transcriptional regulator [Streptomyces platensis]
MTYRAADPALRQQVLGYRAFRFEGPKAQRRIVAPDGMVRVVLGFRGTLRITDAVHPARSMGATSLVSGVRATGIVSEHSGPLHGITVMMTPLGAHRLLNMPMSYLADRHLDLADLLDPRLARQVRRLAHEGHDWEFLFSLLDEVLAALIRRNPQPAPEVGDALRELLRSAGRTSVKQLAAQTRCSSRQLERGFLEQVGLPPKSLAQIVRLQEALRLKYSGLTWADTAAAAGYHDQSHLVRSFKALVGCTPSRFSRARSETDWDGPLDPLPARIPCSTPSERTPCGVAFVQDLSCVRGDAFSR